jgi:non-homologous end joining protein Ku
MNKELFSPEMAENRKANNLKLAFGVETINLSWADDTSETDEKNDIHQWHGDCLKRIRYKVVCEGCGKEVEKDEIVKAKGKDKPEHEPFRAEEFEQFRYKRKCEMLGLIKPAEIPAEYIVKAITLYPALEDSKKNANKFDAAQLKAFEKLVNILQEKSILTKIVLRGSRERNAIIVKHPIHSNLLKCYILRYNDEVRAFNDLDEKVKEARKTITLNDFEKQQIEMVKKMDFEANPELLKDKQTELISEFLASKEFPETEKPVEKKVELVSEMIRTLKEKKKEAK